MPTIIARIAALALLSLVSLPAFALEDTQSNREQQADRYLQANPPASVMNDMAGKMAQSLPVEQREEFKQAISKYLDINRIAAANRAALVKTFTADELQALADFYGSALGKSTREKMGDYLAEVGPATMQEIQTALLKAQQANGKKQ